MAHMHFLQYTYPQNKNVPALSGYLIKTYLDMFVNISENVVPRSRYVNTEVIVLLVSIWSIHNFHEDNLCLTCEAAGICYGRRGRHLLGSQYCCTRRYISHPKMYH